MPGPVIKDYIEIWRGTISPKIAATLTYIHVKSIFNDAWYNLIIPTVGVKAFPWLEVEKLITTEKRRGVSMSLYIDELWVDEYKPVLLEREFSFLGTDTYVYRELSEAYEIKNMIKIVPLNERLLDQYIKVASKCFAEWPNEA
jgi:hypothetical protein